MSREEILKERLGEYLLSIEDLSKGTKVIPHIIHKAMDQYAKQQILSFGEYELYNDVRYENGKNEEWGKLNYFEKVDKFLKEYKQ